LSVRAVVGLGANLGDRLVSMREAVRLLARSAVVERTSHVYRTTPVGGPPQPEFLNAAALLIYPAPLPALLDVLLDVEAALGRVRGERWGPRTIDLDLLWAQGLAVATDALVVPHPRLRERAFALAPMLEIAPDATDPHGDPYVIPPGEIWITDVLL
jgi:2-amino-4-hydroxy-6-hydroxymethyldihydropteridine diphosphokinase